MSGIYKNNEKLLLIFQASGKVKRYTASFTNKNIYKVRYPSLKDLQRSYVQAPEYETDYLRNYSSSILSCNLKKNFIVSLWTRSAQWCFWKRHGRIPSLPDRLPLQI